MHQKSDLSKTVDVVGAATRSPHQLLGRIYTSKLQKVFPFSFTDVKERTKTAPEANTLDLLITTRIHAWFTHPA